VLSWLTPRPSLPKSIDEALDASPGAFSGGVGFNVQIWQQLIWLCRFVEHWKEQPTTVRAGALADPWRFRDVATRVGQDWPSIRYCLEYLVWPAVFPSVVNAGHRRRIRDAFSETIGGSTGKTDEAVTRDLLAIRSAHERDAGGFVYWYSDPYAPMWQAGKDEGQRAWLLRPNPGGTGATGGRGGRARGRGCRA
jgi:5-methylcytosine-specific restriction protein B